jgi:uncharacterized protein YifN (PemK superfamily)
MAINFTPKTGQVLECDFGQFGESGTWPLARPDVNRRLPPEMVKNRLVIVLNGRLSRQSCIVVPLSTSLDRAKAGAGMHVEVAARLIPTFDYFERSKRWAKADCVHTVSKLRLRVPATNGIPAEWVVESDLLRRIQRAAVTAMNASSLLIPLDERALLIEAGWPQEQAS